MKKLALTICVLLGLTGVARAQDQNEILTMPLSAPCFATKDAAELLRKSHGEIPFAVGESVVWNSKIKEYVQVLTVIYANPKDFSFTVAYEVIEDGVTCVMTTGSNLTPATRGPKL